MTESHQISQPGYGSPGDGFEPEWLKGFGKTLHQAGVVRVRLHVLFTGAGNSAFLQDYMMSVGIQTDGWKWLCAQLEAM